MRHVAYANTLTTRRPGTFAEAAGAKLRAAWAEYDGCRRDATCAPTLCGPARVDPLWTTSALAREAIADADDAQWQHASTWLEGHNAPRAAPSGEAAIERARGLADIVAVCAEGAGAVGAGDHAGEAMVRGKVAACARHMWTRNVTQFIYHSTKVPAAEMHAGVRRVPAPSVQHSSTRTR